MKKKPNMQDALYLQLTKQVDALTNRQNVDGIYLQRQPKGAMGLTPDHIRDTDEWQGHYCSFWHLQKEIGKINKYLAKNFKLELRERSRLRRLPAQYV